MLGKQNPDGTGKQKKKRRNSSASFVFLLYNFITSAFEVCDIFVCVFEAETFDVSRRRVTGSPVDDGLSFYLIEFDFLCYKPFEGFLVQYQLYHSLIFVYYTP